MYALLWLLTLWYMNWPDPCLLHCSIDDKTRCLNSSATRGSSPVDFWGCWVRVKIFMGLKEIKEWSSQHCMNKMCTPWLAPTQCRTVACHWQWGGLLSCFLLKSFPVSAVSLSTRSFLRKNITTQMRYRWLLKFLLIIETDMLYWLCI